MNEQISGSFSNDSKHISELTTIATSGEEKPHIHLLSDDLLLEVFGLALREALFSEQETPLQYIFAAVCHHWRELVLHYPLLWSEIKVPSNNAYDPFIYFERSKPALIDVGFESVGQWIPAGSDLPDKLSNAIATNSSRLRCLTIHVWQCQDLYPIFHAWRELATPNFVKLRILCVSRVSPTANVEFPVKLRFPEIPNPLWTDGDSLTSLTLDSCDLELLPALPRLAFLDIDRCENNRQDLQSILNSHPLLTTLVVRRFEEPIGIPHAPQPDEVDASSLKSIAIHIGQNHGENCQCVLPYLSARNLEYLELSYMSPSFSNHHAAILSRWTTFSNLRKLRIHSLSLWRNDISFLSFLPGTTNLEIVDFPDEDIQSLIYILTLTNLHSITFDLHSPRNPESSLDVNHFTEIVRDNISELSCPVMLHVAAGSNFQMQHGLKTGFEILYSSTKDGFLDAYLRNHAFDHDLNTVTPLWDSDEEFFEENDFDFDDFEQRDAYDYEDESDFDNPEEDYAAYLSHWG